MSFGNDFDQPFQRAPHNTAGDDNRDQVILMRVKEYIEPTSSQQALVARCVRTTHGNVDGVDAFYFVVITHRVPIDTPIVALRVNPYTGFGVPEGSGEVPTILWQQLATTPAQRIGMIVCNGPKGEDDFSDNRQWVQIKTITAPCDPTQAWTLADAPPVKDPCPGSGEAMMIPAIVACFNVGKATVGEHEQPGKLVMLTPLETSGDPYLIRWACENIDSAENGQKCGESSSSSNGSNRCWAKWSVDVNCATGFLSVVSGVTDAQCGGPDLHTPGEWFCDGAGIGPPGETWKRLSVWTREDDIECAENGDCMAVFAGWSEDTIQNRRPPLPTQEQALVCCSSSSGTPSGSGSDKSTAIVPAKFSPTGYAALFTLESPEVRFDDVLIAEIEHRNTSAPIDPRYLEVCEAGSIEVCSITSDLPASIGARVEGGSVLIRFTNQRSSPIRVVIRLTGIRKGFAGKRFPTRTREQFEANERFINSAYPGAGRA